jgi:chromatin segregation and condensation protein Rec8/ScpA/Scc1 (kleisin family)
MRATVFASSLAATLELVLEGALDVHQAAAFAPIHVRKRTSGPERDSPATGVAPN